ncbi:MAG: heavy-metal-associated domain-containing protein [Bacteroidales bacterium]|nr:heavy-metal-associated domain-containing protein [Bacteroidales bacterium]
MKNLFFVVLATLIQVVFFCPDIDCPHCSKKIYENIAFEKGVKDLSVEVDSRQVTVKFNAAKTDTLALGKALAKIGYPAQVVEYREVRK